VVPQWYYPFDRIATWDTYGRPQTLPSQNPGYANAWWVDPAKAGAVKAARGK
jgi:microcin C transport system substrate-binding protein